MNKPQRLLLVFPHPDDESYGCGGTIAKYVNEGQTEVYLLTLTRGEASSQGPRLGLTKEQMGEKRSKEMQEVARIYGLSELFLLDFPDGRLEHLDPRELEEAVVRIALQISPQVIISYPPHGISGFIDHLITHAVAKRAFVELREQNRAIRRFAMHCVTENIARRASRVLRGDPEDQIDCSIAVQPFLETKRRALEVQQSIAAVIEQDNVDNLLLQPYETYRFFQERFSPPLRDLFEQLPEWQAL